MLMLRSPLPVTVLDLLLTFLLRTLVVAPVLVVGALLLA
jgi:nucleoside recognition membrane protein YjiH